MATSRKAPLSLTGVRKLPVGTTVCLVAAPHVRFTRSADGTWAEVPRHAATFEPRVKTSSELFLLGVAPID
jgi:hypothetical protein